MKLYDFRLGSAFLAGAIFLLTLPVNAESNVSQEAAQDAREVLSGMADQVLERDFEGFVDYLAKEDRQRIGDLSDAQLTSFKSAVDRANSAWRSKYKADFDLSSETDQRRALNFDVSTMGEKTDQAKVRIPTSHGLPQTELELEKGGILGTGYRVNIPNTVSGPQLAESLASQLKAMSEAQSEWPADKIEASKMLTHRIALALKGESAGEREVLTGEIQG